MYIGQNGKVPKEFKKHAEEIETVIMLTKEMFKANDISFALAFNSVASLLLRLLDYVKEKDIENHMKALVAIKEMMESKIKEEKDG